MLASIRLLVFLLAFLVFAPAARAQQHETRENTRCRFARFPYTNSEGGVVCYACVADKEKEHQAKAAADKQRAAAQDAANAAKQDAEQVAFKKKQQQEDQQKTARQRSGEVLINGNASNFDLTARKPAAKDVASGTVLAYGNIRYSGQEGASFENENHKEIILNSDWDGAYAIPQISLTASAPMPQTWGLIKYKLGRGTGGMKHEFIDACYQSEYYGGLDLVNAKGTTLFNNKYITSITYIKDDWFMLGIDSSEVRGKHKYRDKLYNIRTNKFIALPRKFTMGGWVATDCGGYEADKYEADEHFIPIFGSNTTLGTINSRPYNIMISTSKKVKDKLTEYAPQIVNEAILNAYSFAIVCTEGQGYYLGEARTPEKFFSEYPYRKLMLITKEGKVIYKDL